MKALVYTAPEHIEYTDTDESTARTGEVIVEIRAAGICGSDMHAFHGHDPRRVPPLILGHEASGVCLTGTYQGRAVALNPLISCHVCAHCAEGRPNLCTAKSMIGLDRPGTMAERVSLPEGNLVPLPQGMHHECAALAEPAATALHGIRLLAEQAVRPLGECEALVVGAGSIGLLCALILRWWGVAEPTVAELNALRRETVTRGGFGQVIDGVADEPQAAAYHLVVDAVGTPATRQLAMRSVRRGGAVLSLGLQAQGGALDARRLTLEEISLLGSYTYTPADFRAAVHALHEGRLGPLDWLETRPLAAGTEAFKDLDAERTAAAKIVLEP